MPTDQPIIHKFIEQAFLFFDLNWKDYVEIDGSLRRPSDIQYGAADTTKATKILGWSATHDVDDVIRLMCEYAQSSIQI
jgi:GDPmannose 4,6-dehydratase